MKFINDELKERGWSLRELARRSDQSPTTVTDILGERRGATFDFCAAVAKPLGLDPVFLFELAGLIPPRARGEARLVARLAAVAEWLPEAMQAELLDFAEFLLQKSQAAPPQSPPLGGRSEDEVAAILIEKGPPLSFELRPGAAQSGHGMLASQIANQITPAIEENGDSDQA
jgi:transcriptional regulator with XRE-family HTH domain